LKITTQQSTERSTKSQKSTTFTTLPTLFSSEENDMTSYQVALGFTQNQKTTTHEHQLFDSSIHCSIVWQLLSW